MSNENKGFSFAAFSKAKIHEITVSDQKIYFRDPTTPEFRDFSSLGKLLQNEKTISEGEVKFVDLMRKLMVNSETKSDDYDPFIDENGTSISTADVIARIPGPNLYGLIKAVSNAISNDTLKKLETQEEKTSEQ